jgi:hypothetical protein
LQILVGAHSLNFIPSQYQHRVGNLFSPGGFWNHKLDFALDNGVYAAWKKGEEWSEQNFLAHLGKIQVSGKAPMWVVCPDVVGDCLATRKKWDLWSDRLRSDYTWLWYCYKCGAKSIDGTGWFWKNKRENQDLLDFLAITEGDRLCETNALFPIHQYISVNK